MCRKKGDAATNERSGKRYPEENRNMRGCTLRYRTAATLAAWFFTYAVFTCAIACAAHAAEPEFVPSADLLAAARKEGKVVLYTANFLDTEQAVLRKFAV
jgi:hypothetical protein